MAETLAAHVPCPETTWKRIEREIAGAPGVRRGRRSFFAVGGLAAAAILAFAVFIGGGMRPTQASFMELGASGIDEFCQQAHVSGCNEDAQRYLHAHGLLVEVLPLADMGDTGPHEPVALLGARTTEYRGEYVGELLYACCGYPVKVIIAREDSEAARLMETAFHEGGLLHSHSDGAYRTALVGAHPAHGLLETVRTAG